jgi:uncharacterized membrane protein YphA (DoxX/SURF4 family)
VIKNIFAWILTIFLLIAFAFAGGAKLVSNPAMVQEFAQIGLGQWFRYFTGILELGGAIGLLIPRARFWAALDIAAVMVGATFTNIAVLHLPPLARLTAVLLGLALVLAWLRRPTEISLTSGRPQTLAAPAQTRPSVQ